MNALTEPLVWIAGFFLFMLGGIVADRQHQQDQKDRQAEKDRNGKRDQDGRP